MKAVSGCAPCRELEPKLRCCKTWRKNARWHAFHQGVWKSLVAPVVEGWSRQHTCTWQGCLLNVGTLAFLKMLCLTKGRGTVWYSAAVLASHWSGFWGAWTRHIKGILYICVVRRLRSTFFCRQEREKLRQSNAKAPVSVSSLGEAGSEDVGHGTVCHRFS